MKKIPVLLLLSLLFSFANAKTEFGFQVEPGISQIAFHFKKQSGYTWVGDYPKTAFSISGNAGIFLNFRTDKKIGFGTELSFSQIEGIEKNKFREGNTDSNTISIAISRNISYLSLPVCCILNIRSFHFAIGIQTSLRVKSSGSEIIDGTQYSPSFYRENFYSKLNIPFHDIGGKAKTVIKLNERVSLSASFYYGFKNLVYDNIYFDSYGANPIKYRARQITIGWSYTFGPKIPDEDETIIEK